MSNQKVHLENAFNLLCQISVKDADVDRMAAAKQILKAVYAALPDEANGGGENGG